MELTITLLGADSPGILGHSVQQPTARDDRALYAFKLTGWVVGRQGPVDRVELVDGDRIIQSVAVDGSRPNIARRFPETPWAASSGFRMMVDSLAFAGAIDCALRAVLSNGAAVPLARIQGERAHLPHANPAFMQPLIVTSLGRTGTTWLMRLLAEHPAIVAYRRYPYEVRPGLYWTHMLRVLSGVPDYARPLSHPDNFTDDPFAVGANPFHAAGLDEYPDLQAWAGQSYIDNLARFCQENIETWYRRLAESQNQPAAAFFAEKHLPNEYPALLWESYPGAREIFLVRDFRDLASSALAFNAQRGFNDFGRELVGSDAAFLDQLRGGGQQLLDSWRRRAGRSHLVRYEDLVRSPDDTIRAMLSYAGVDASPGIVAGMIERAAAQTSELRQHQTSGSPTASIGRWRRDLDPNLQMLAGDVFKDLLAGFGYE